jgi:hypothetical protein
VNVTVKADARHVQRRHRGHAAELVEQRTFGVGAFARPWLRLRFPDGWEQWVPEERVERAARLLELEAEG